MPRWQGFNLSNYTRIYQSNSKISAKYGKMSIVSLSTQSSSAIGEKHLQEIAYQLQINISNPQDASDYLTILRSFEAVMKFVEDGPDYLHPSLQPQPVSTNRNFWKPNPLENPLNAWSHRCNIKAEHVKTDALQGRTVAIKDNISVGGLPTTLGALPALLSKDDAFPNSPIDATVVSRILSAGGVIKGTSTCECFCASPLSFTSMTGPVHNPLLYGYTSGGSSSGSSVLVAANAMASGQGSPWGEMAELAIGSDQAGSVRIPAAYNGIYGLKPTFGLVPYTGAASMSPMIDHLGPIASCLEDISALLGVMAGYDGLDSRMTPESPLTSQVKSYAQILSEFRNQLLTTPETARGWKIGLLTESFQMLGVAKEVRDAVIEAATQYFRAAGATVVDTSIPMHKEGPIIWTASTRPSMARWLCEGKTSGHLSYLSPHIEPQPLTQRTYEMLTSYNPALVNIILSEKLSEKFLSPGIEAKAHRRVFELRNAYDAALEEVDVLITPCAPTIAMPHPDQVTSEGNPSPILDRLGAAVGLTSNTCPFNVTGHPAMNVPCGFASPPNHPDVQLPIGMQVVGKHWFDEKVIMAAALFEVGRDLKSRGAAEE